MKVHHFPLHSWAYLWKNKRRANLQLLEVAKAIGFSCLFLRILLAQPCAQRSKKSYISSVYLKHFTHIAVLIWVLTLHPDFRLSTFCGKNRKWMELQITYFWKEYESFLSAKSNYSERYFMQALQAISGTKCLRSCAVQKLCETKHVKTARLLKSLLWDVWVGRSNNRTISKKRQNIPILYHIKSSRI